MKLVRRLALLGILLAAAVLCACQLLLPKILIQTENLDRELKSGRDFLAENLQEGFINRAAIQSYDKINQSNSPNNYDAHAVYTSPQGIDFISKSERWDKKKLESLYEELLRNRHGKELFSLTQVIVHAQEDQYAAATHESRVDNTYFKLSHPAISPQFQVVFKRDTGVIELYGGDDNTTVASMASNLSHEYGHHFTYYYMFPEDDDRVLKSDYAKLRKLPDAAMLTDRSDGQFYYNNHHRYLVEIAAEDYVALMGSSASRSVEDYLDIWEMHSGEEQSTVFARNARVQENLTLPMAQEVKGLADYFYGLIGEKTAKFTPGKPFALNIDSFVNSYDLETGYEEFWSYNITWDKVYGEDAVYTLVCYDPENYVETLYPIKTVFSGENAIGTVGRVASESGDRVYYSWDTLAQGTRTFAVTVILPDGTMQISQPLTHTF